MAALSPSFLLLATCFLCLFLLTTADDPPTEDCVKDLTDKYQGILNSSYPKLYEMIASQSSEAGKDQRGSFQFLNVQDKLFKLKCPCKGSYKWTLLDDDKKEAEEFNKEKYTTEEVRARTPKPKNYFRTYKCTAGDKYHYFNVFTRPLPVTTFPVQWVAGQTRDTVEGNKLKFECRGKAFKGSLGGEAFTYKWILPKNDSTRAIGKVLEDTEAEANGLKFSLGPITVKGEKGDEKIQGAIVTSKSEEASLESAGRYECIVIDVNGLTSSFNLDKARLANGDKDMEKAFGKEPKIRFAGYVDVHVRMALYVWWPLVALGVAVVIFVVLVCFCPDQREKFGSEDSGNQKGSDKAKGKGAAEVEAAKSVELHPSATAPTPEKKKKKRRKKKKKSGAHGEESEVVTPPAKA